jgi:hypothetical protein
VEFAKDGVRLSELAEFAFKAKECGESSLKTYSPSLLGRAVIV